MSSAWQTYIYFVSSVAARFMFKKAGVRLTAYTPSGLKELLEL